MQKVNQMWAALEKCEQARTEIHSLLMRVIRDNNNEYNKYSKLVSFRNLYTLDASLIQGISDLESLIEIEEEQTK